MSLAELIRVARGEKPADLLLASARLVNVFTGEIESTSVAVYGGRIAGVGDYQAKEVVDLGGKYLAPGLISGHVHLESSMLDVGQYARAVVPRGTTSIVTDLHEIANVSGLAGVRYVLDCARRLPLDLFLMAPSCVPATHLETSGAVLGTEDLRRLLRLKNCLGLGEMMNFPGVLFGDPAVLAKLALSQNRVIDGHAPGLAGKDLSAYITAGMSSDHESVALAEAREKLAKGMYVMIREGSSEKNLATLLPLVTEQTSRRCLLVVDDRTPVDILKDGDMDAVVRKAIALGCEPVTAIRMATLNTAERFRLTGLGAVAPGYQANLLVLDDLGDFRVESVYYRGRLVAHEGKMVAAPGKSPRSELTGTVKVKPFHLKDLELHPWDKTMPVVEVVPGQIVTRKVMERVRVVDGEVVPDTARDILKLVVVERHKSTGNIGRGLVKGFGLRRGALASSVAHDSHNIVAVGTDDKDIYVAVKEIERLQGGLVAASGGKVLASLPLPIAGLLSDQPLETMVSRLEKLERIARELGTKLPSPFATLSFLALPVIPELRVTDLGVVDVGAFKVIG